jgi:phosphate transport system permease protein
MNELNELVDKRAVEESETAPLQERKEGMATIGMVGATAIDTAGAHAVLAPTRSRNLGDMLFGGIVRTAVWIFLTVFIGIVIVLVVQSLPSIQRSGLAFLYQEGWDPVSLVFGAGPFILDTIIVAAVAMVLAGTIGLASAIYLVEYSPRWLREPAAFLIELLAFIPSVVYGLWGLLIMTPWLALSVEPWLQQTFGASIPFFNGPPYGVGILAAILILSIMLLPLIVSLSREALLLVPDTQREAMLALGATRWEVLRQAVIPYARSGIFGAIILSLGRALGETMAIAMTIGGGFQFIKTAMDQGYTLASVIANEFNEVSSDAYLSALIECGLILFIITSLVNIGAYYILRRMNQMHGSVTSAQAKKKGSRVAEQGATQ